LELRSCRSAKAYTTWTGSVGQRQVKDRSKTVQRQFKDNSKTASPVHSGRATVTRDTLVRRPRMPGRELARSAVFWEFVKLGAAANREDVEVWVGALCKALERACAWHGRATRLSRTRVPTRKTVRSRPFVTDTTRGSAEQEGDGRTDGARVVEEVGRQREGEACRQAADRLDQPAHKAVRARRRQGTQALARRRRRSWGVARGAGHAADMGGTCRS